MNEWQGGAIIRIISTNSTPITKIWVNDFTTTFELEDNVTMAEVKVPKEHLTWLEDWNNYTVGRLEVYTTIDSQYEVMWEEPEYELADFNNKNDNTWHYYVVKVIY